MDLQGLELLLFINQDNTQTKYQVIKRNQNNTQTNIK